MYGEVTFRAVAFGVLADSGEVSQMFMPAWCPHCNKMVEGTGGISIEGAGSVTNFTLENNAIITCSECKRYGAQVVSGTFNVRAGIIDIVAASPWTRAKLAEFQSALRSAVDHYEENPEAAIAELTAAQPAMAPFLHRMLFESWSRAEVLAALSLLVGVIALILSQRGGDTTVEITNVEINNYINECSVPVPGEDDPGPDGPPMPPPESPPPPGPGGGEPPSPQEPPATESPV